MKNFLLKSLTSSFSTQKYFFPFLGISLFLVIFCLFGSIWVQNLVATVGILTFGILHGANDLKIIAKKSSFHSTTYRFKFFLLYSIIVLLGIVLFFYIPKIALFSFVLVSCYHFGEQHWNERFNDQFNSFAFYFSYGSIIFSLLFTIQYTSSAEIIFQITSVIQSGGVEGMQTLDQDLQRLVTQGKIERKVAMEIADNPKLFKQNVL